MRTIEKEEIKKYRTEILSMLSKGDVFIYPTDTIYGIGCDATNDEAVKKVREIKERPTKPFSVIAPSKEWIREHCEVTEKEEPWLRKLPGPYTLILNLKKQNNVSKMVNPGFDSIGVRMPDHWILDLVEEFGKPIITPSANVSGGEFMTSNDDMDPRLKSMTNVLLYEGEKKGQPSTIVNLTDKAVDASGKRKVI